MKSRNGIKRLSHEPATLRALLLFPWCFLWALFLGMPAYAATDSVHAVPSVDLNRYQGQWYEIVRLPLSWEKKCASLVTATYTLRPDGDITVLNSCQRINGKMTSSRGKAQLAVAGGPTSKLKVTFFWPFRGDYWVIGIDPDYRWSLVGTPDKKYLWLLSRTPTMASDQVNRILGRAVEMGFDVKDIIYTKQN